MTALYRLPTPLHVRGMHVAQRVRADLIRHGLGDTPACRDLSDLLGAAPDLALLYATVFTGAEILLSVREAHALQVEAIERHVQAGTIPKSLLAHLLDDPAQARLRETLALAQLWAAEVPTNAIYPEDRE